MKGYVPTPSAIVDRMVAKAFVNIAVSATTTVLDPGCGEGQFIEGVLRWAAARGTAVPTIVGVELDPARAAVARRRFARYRAGYTTARGRFDLYLLFFEQALRLLSPTGRLVFISPQKYTYVATARPLRALLLRTGVAELEFAPETAFGDLVTDPLITTLDASRPDRPTVITLRDGTRRTMVLRSDRSWLPDFHGAPPPCGGVTLGDVALRISCGVATGADAVFAIRDADLTAALRPFAHPTVAGRQLVPGQPIRTSDWLLAPYDDQGRLLPADRLGALGRFLGDRQRKNRLRSRTCAARKPWFAFHDNFLVDDLRRPKLLCKDIVAEPFFVADPEGRIVPRHSVYYVVPADPTDLPELHEYLHSPDARAWLAAHCQRAAKGFLRMQSSVLRALPLPSHFAPRIGAFSAGQVAAVPT